MICIVYIKEDVDHYIGYQYLHIYDMQTIKLLNIKLFSNFYKQYTYSQPPSMLNSVHVLKNILLHEQPYLRNNFLRIGEISLLNTNWLCISMFGRLNRFSVIEVEASNLIHIGLK